MAFYVKDTQILRLVAVLNEKREAFTVTCILYVTSMHLQFYYIGNVEYYNYAVSVTCCSMREGDACTQRIDLKSLRHCTNNKRTLLPIEFFYRFCYLTTIGVLNYDVTSLQLQTTITKLELRTVIIYTKITTLVLFLIQ